jgi:hypothetical protein
MTVLAQKILPPRGKDTRGGYHSLHLQRAPRAPGLFRIDFAVRQRILFQIGFCLRQQVHHPLTGLRHENGFVSFPCVFAGVRVV